MNQQSWFNHATSCCFKLAPSIMADHSTKYNSSQSPESTSCNSSGCPLCRKEAPIIPTKTKHHKHTDAHTVQKKIGKNQIKWSIGYLHACTAPFACMCVRCPHQHGMDLPDLDSDKSKNTRDSVPLSEIAFTWRKTHRRHISNGFTKKKKAWLSSQLHTKM